MELLNEYALEEVCKFIPVEDMFSLIKAYNGKRRFADMLRDIAKRKKELDFTSPMWTLRENHEFALGCLLHNPKNVRRLGINILFIEQFHTKFNNVVYPQVKHLTMYGERITKNNLIFKLFPNIEYCQALGGVNYVMSYIFCYECQ